MWLDFYGYYYNVSSSVEMVWGKKGSETGVAIGELAERVQWGSWDSKLGQW